VAPETEEARFADSGEVEQRYSKLVGGSRPESVGMARQ